MPRTLNELISAAVLGDDTIEQSPPATAAVTYETTKVASEVVEDYGDIEKLASALEFLGRKGVSTMLVEKVAAKSGNVGTNEGTRPGGSKGVSTQGTESGTSHPALASNQAAIDYDKKVKSQRTSPALKKVLAATPFADNTLKKVLTNASGKGDKNIHKNAHDLEVVRQELERRAAAGGA